MMYPHLLGPERPGRKDYTTGDLEAFYRESGRKVPGSCEVRYAWKFNDLKPRIYYSIGAEAFFAARYVWAIFDRVQRLFRGSNPNSRYTFIHFPFIDFDEEVFMIYDYASFTSRLADFKRFVGEMAVFLDVECWIFDTAVGMKKDNLRQILEEYNRVCNMDGRFSIHKLPGSRSDQAIILHHKVAGMLGVFGNITGSTSLHGIVGIMSTGEENRINTIGDDAGGVWKKDMSIDQIKEAIRSIGEIADEKFEIWEQGQEDIEEDDSWHYTKRPIRIENGIVVQGWLPEFPIIGYSLPRYPDHITIRRESLIIRRRTFLKQTCRFLTSCAFRQIDDSDVQMILDILKDCYYRLSLPVGGSLPKRYSKPADGRPFPDEVLCVPKLSEETIRRGWWQVLKDEADRSGVIRLPATEARDDLPEVLVEGHTFRHEGNPVLSVLRNIGVVRSEVLYEDRLITEETLELLDSILLGQRHRLYQFTVLEDYPAWTSYYQLVYSLS